MMQIGGVDNLVLKEVKLPVETEQEESKVRAGEERSEEKASESAVKADEKEKQERAEETERSVYGDVVGKSSDGDTTRVKKDAMEALEAGMVFTKDDKENNLMEFNRDQLKVMVEKSDITENRYNHEISRRDEIMEKDEESAFAKTNAEMIEKQKEEAEKKAREKAKERLDEIQGKGEEPENANKAQEEENANKAQEEENANKAQEEESENTQRVENGMNRLAASVKGLEIEEEGVLDAAQNGRSDVIDQILNPEDGNLKVIIR